MISNIAKLMRDNSRMTAGAAAIALTLGAGLATVLGQEEEERNLPIEQTHSVNDAPAPVPGAIFGSGPALRPGDRICTTATQFTANVDTDCEKSGPSNETSIAVNPTDENNMIGGANDYQLAINPGGQVSQAIHSRAHVTFDGGKTWSEYPIAFGGTYQATGDPAVAFDAAGRAYYATLGFRFVGPANALTPTSSSHIQRTEVKPGSPFASPPEAEISAAWVICWTCATARSGAPKSVHGHEGHEDHEASEYLFSLRDLRDLRDLRGSTSS